MYDFTQYIVFNPDDADAYNNRGLGYAYSGQYDKALNDWDKAREIDPDHLQNNNPDVIEIRRRLLEDHPELKP